MARHQKIPSKYFFSFKNKQFIKFGWYFYLNGALMKSNNTIDESDIQILDEINNLITKNKGVYKSALVITALAKQQNSWKNVFTKITLSNEDGDFSEKLEYDNFILNKISITVDDFLKMIDDLVRGGELKIKNCPEAKAIGNFETSSYWRYRSSNDKQINNEWPTNHYIFIMDHEVRGNASGDPLVSSRYPHFPNADSAIKYYNEFDLGYYSGSIFLFLPNYQLKIDELSIGSEHLDLKLIMNDIKQEELIGKIYCEKEGLIKTEDFSIDENPKRIHLSFIPDIMSIYVLKNDGEILDFRRIYLSWPSSPSKDVVIDVKEADVLTMIKQGENQHIEFKKELNNKYKGEFIESVVAFANGEGGAILLGVDDKSNIVGFSTDKIEEQIINIIRSGCVPFIEPEIKSVTIDDKPITIVGISKGTNKPYTLGDRGVYVRRGSTDRIASRIELDEFYKEKNNHELKGI